MTGRKAGKEKGEGEGCQKETRDKRREGRGKWGTG